ncbi:cytochrome c biogenesis CcdA family protein [Sporichthya polymorpha]|uniref:cytochrome c biogenesis CcdA family protein n=1 Tax=Sporichthya polymorpha TaxID=35751 RepID=UPI00037A0A73|nr:cytochrome c biogenesis protein CcdA [Sporichthya polymorpha]
MNGLLALAFAAGMIAPVNPCGFALLPAWITHTLVDREQEPLPVRLLYALRAGAALTLGFAGTLAVVGLAISAGARALISAAPWLGLATGIALLVLGAVMLTGRSLRLRIRLPSGSREAAGPPSARRLAAFGVGYAAASLSCTLGVLLAVIGQAQATASYAGLLAVFAAYASGAAAVLLLVSVTAAAAGAALTGKITALARHGTRISAAVLVLTGAYLAWYWYPAATGGTSNGLGLGAFSITVSTWLQAHTTTVATLAALTVLAVTAVALHHRLRAASATTSAPPGAPTVDRLATDVPPQISPAAESRARRDG